jgi:hypothetical protein
MPHDGSQPVSLLKPQALIALRDLVYADLLSLLPVASADQTDLFMANLRLPEAAVWKFLDLKVSPELGETVFNGLNPRTALWYLNGRYGNVICEIAGFYRDGRGALSWTVPGGCALYGYRSRTGAYNGILCQPLYAIDKFWLLSSSKFGGPKALRLTDHDAALFEAGLVTYPARRAAARSRKGATV